MKTKLKQYIEMRGITIKQAAEEIGVSRPLIHYAINGNPLSRRTALKIEKWSDGFVSAVELVGLGSNQKSA
jgi:plasmid maintenance system antidote protein VapI